MKLCIIEGCKNKQQARGWCHAHYRRWKRHGDPTIVKTNIVGFYNDTHRECTICKTIKEHKDFPLTSKTGQVAIRSKCKKCISIYNRSRAYGITFESLQQAMLLSGGLCYICGVEDDLVVDHDHLCCPDKSTIKPTCGDCNRGLLCRSCNQGLGNFKDDPVRLQKAIDYLANMGRLG